MTQALRSTANETITTNCAAIAFLHAARHPPVRAAAHGSPHSGRVEGGKVGARSNACQLHLSTICRQTNQRRALLKPRRAGTSGSTSSPHALAVSRERPG